MRERWGPGAKTLALTPLELTSLVQPAFPGQSVVANDLTSGGLVNTNVRLELSVHRRPVLLRLYTRDPNADAAPMPEVAAKEAALHDRIEFGQLLDAQQRRILLRGACRGRGAHVSTPALPRRRQLTA